MRPGPGQLPPLPKPSRSEGSAPGGGVAGATYETRLERRESLSREAAPVPPGLRRPAGWAGPERGPSAGGGAARPAGDARAPRHGAGGGRGGARPLVLPCLEPLVLS